MTGIKNVIFDLDGTLSDSGILTLAAMELAAPRFGLPMPAMDAVRAATGFDNPEFYYILYPDTSREKLREMGQMVEEDELRLLPGVRDRLLFKDARELLNELIARKINLYIASTGDNDHVFSILRETGIRDFFMTVSCGRPDKVKMLGDIIGDGDKSSFIMVGDMKKDSEGARANGILSVGACYGYCKRELGEFDLYINNPMELLDILER
ncbi:MAG: HAD family hydrolase [Defluviitaleaceae bacterium]|nr:HAD family hydrolase [Defluviitaleaceae bacterium]